MMCTLPQLFFFFFFNDTATTEIYTLSLHDALPIYDYTSSFTVLRPNRIIPHETVPHQMHLKTTSLFVRLYIFTMGAWAEHETGRRPVSLGGIQNHSEANTQRASLAVPVNPLSIHLHYS